MAPHSAPHPGMHLPVQPGHQPKKKGAGPAVIGAITVGVVILAAAAAWFTNIIPH
jgi:hypothetical protein